MGFHKANTGQSSKPESLVPLELLPLAIDAEMDGLPVTMKLPQMRWNARIMSGPKFGVGGPKYAARSVPWRAMGTEYWYL